jgi:hypothetical protein
VLCLQKKQLPKLSLNYPVVYRNIAKVVEVAIDTEEYYLASGIHYLL